MTRSEPAQFELFDHEVDCLAQALVILGRAFVVAEVH
jgi:hypothetical protein